MRWLDIDAIVKAVVNEINKLEKSEAREIKIPIGISNRHIHLSEEDFKILFGSNAKLTSIKELSQPGQFSCSECVTIIGLKGCIERVRILGPFRNETQVEILASDTYKLGIECTVRESGNLDNTPGIIAAGPEGCIRLKRGVIIAKRHIHMTLADALEMNCCDGDEVEVEFHGERGGRFERVLVRVSNKYKLDFHIDLDEANAFGLKSGDHVKIVNKK